MGENGTADNMTVAATRGHALLLGGVLPTWSFSYFHGRLFHFEHTNDFSTPCPTAHLYRSAVSSVLLHMVAPTAAYLIV